MTDDFDPIRRLRPDRVLPDEYMDPDILGRERERLLSEIAPTPPPIAWRPTPSIYPRLAYRDERAALEFLTRAFGFVERREARLEHDDGLLAWLELGTGVVMIGRAGPDHHGLSSPADVGAATGMVNVYVDDVDAHHRQAVEQGAEIASEPKDMFWGDRRYEAYDLEGHRWHFAERRPRP